MKIRVELDMFSGRPNPCWDLTSGEAREFRDMFLKLPALRQSGAYRQGGLGYRGMIVRAKKGSIDSPQEVLVFRGLVRAMYDDKVVEFTDGECALERWLLGTARERLGGELYKQLLSEVERK